MLRATIRIVLITVLLFYAAYAFADATFLERPDGTFRFMSYNPYWDAIFTTGIRRYTKADEFIRVLGSVRPDIVALQEVAPSRNPETIETIFNKAIPLGEGEQWYVAKGVDNAIVSRYPVIWSEEVIAYVRGVNSRGHILALIDLPDDAYPSDLAIVGAHFKSGGSDDQIAARSTHADILVAHVRRARNDGLLPAETPLILAGDFNAYATDPRRHMDTLVYGDILDEVTYGADGSLDTGHSQLVDLLPRHNGAGDDVWTWRNDTQQFDPFPLDRILYTGSTISVVGSFVLNTAIMSQVDLDEVDLEAGDVTLNLRRGNFDHLPLVADLTVF